MNIRYKNITQRSRNLLYFKKKNHYLGDIGKLVEIALGGRLWYINKPFWQLLSKKHPFKGVEATV